MKLQKFNNAIVGQLKFLAYYAIFSILVQSCLFDENGHVEAGPDIVVVV